MRPSLTEKWSQVCNLDINIQDTDILEYRKVNKRGIVQVRSIVNKPATVILGHKKTENKKITITKEDQVWTCYFNSRGVMSSISVPDVDITIIAHESIE
jgi:hypothetical protein